MNKMKMWVSNNNMYFDIDGKRIIMPLDQEKCYVEDILNKKKENKEKYKIENSKYRNIGIL